MESSVFLCAKSSSAPGRHFLGSEEGTARKQSFRAVLCTSIYISTFVPNLNFGQDEHKRRRQVLCLNGS